MKMIVVTTITSTFDVESMNTSHSVDIDDQDGLSDVSTDVLGTVLIGAMRATERGLRQKFPGADRAAARVDATDQDGE